MVDLILINSIVVIGMLAGLSTFRDQIVQFFGDAAVALESVDQSYSFTVGATTSLYEDPAPTVTDPNLAPPAGIAFIDATIE